MEIFKGFRPDISVHEVCRLLGSGNQPARSPRTVRAVKRLISSTKPLLSPKVVATEKTIRETSDGKLVIEPGVNLKSRKMTRTIGPCKKIKVFVATVGPAVEEEIQKMTDENRMSEASILDAIASVAVENTVDQFQEQIEEEVSGDGQRTTLRFSPGYCDWNISEQKKVFEVIDGEEIDVSLSDTCLMSPRKSVSGVFGIGDKQEIKQRSTNPCTQCGMRNCIAQRANNTEKESS